MSTDLAATGSLSFLLDIIPVVVIIIIIVAIVLSRHKFLKEKKELKIAIMECEKTVSDNREKTENQNE